MEPSVRESVDPADRLSADTELAPSTPGVGARERLGQAGSESLHPYRPPCSSAPKGAEALTGRAGQLRGGVDCGKGHVPALPEVSPGGQPDKGKGVVSVVNSVTIIPT